MWVSSYLDRWEERLAVEDDGNKPFERLVIGASIAFSGVGANASLLDLEKFVKRHKANSAKFFTADRGEIKYSLDGDLLTFHSDIATETEANDIVRARIYEAKDSRSAIIVLPHWNAAKWSYHALSKQLKRLGITVVELTLPYHGDRSRADGLVADYFLSANIGRTIRSVRQAVADSKRVIDWLYQRNYKKIGLIGISLGSCVAGLVAAHDLRVYASALILTAGDFAEVVWTGRATRHIRAAFAADTTLEPIRNIWSIISTEAYVNQISKMQHRCLVISGNRDRVVLPYLTQRFIDKLRNAGVIYSWHEFGCGHYSLGRFPFNLMTFLMLMRFFRREGF
jgi:hypothetical protein